VNKALTACDYPSIPTMMTNGENELVTTDNGEEK
jgi:hypothetical protein